MKNMRKLYAILIILVILGAAIWGISLWVGNSGGNNNGGNGGAGQKEGQLTSFDVQKPNLTALGRNLSKVEIWLIPAGTGITEEYYSLLGSASLASASGENQVWIFPIPENPMLATGIFARGFDLQGNKVGDEFLPYTGATDIYNALWGPESPEAITIWDNSRTFSYSLTSRFTLKLDGGTYPQQNLKVLPAGIIGSVSNVPAANPSLYAARYEAVATGTCTIKNGDFSVNINVFDSGQGDKTYSNARYGFSVKYSPADILNENITYSFVTENSLVRIDLARNDFMDTNLAEASFIAGASSSSGILDKCLKMSPEEQKQDADETINGISFKVFEGTGAAAGNLYETKSYRTIKKNTCYEAVILLHSGNIGNYSPGAVREFDRQAALDGLEAILGAYSFNQ